LRENKTGQPSARPASRDAVSVQPEAQCVGVSLTHGVSQSSINRKYFSKQLRMIDKNLALRHSIDDYDMFEVEN
jgi:hypothetical protein